MEVEGQGEAGLERPGAEPGDNSPPQAQVGRAGRGARHRKKGGHILRQEPEVKYVFMDEHQALFELSAMSRVLQVSRSGFYAWRKRPDHPGWCWIWQKPDISMTTRSLATVCDGRDYGPRRE